MENNKRIPVSLQTITPVHIGSGRELSGNFEYVYFKDEEKIAVIDPDKIVDIIGEENIDQWVAVIDNEQNLLKDLPQLRQVTAEEIAQRILFIDRTVPNTEKNALKEQLFLGNHKATIPGSSLKGVFRTAILTKLIKDKPLFVQEENNLRNWGKYNDKQLIAEYFGKESYYDRRQQKQISRHSPNKDFLRFLSISDFYFDGQTTAVKSTVANLFRNGWGEKKELSSFWECIPQSAQAEGSIQISNQLIKRIQEKDRNYLDNQKIELLAPKRLFRLINKHSLRLITEEIEFWEEEDNPPAIGDYKSELESIKKRISEIDENSCILRVGAGSGWEFMTGGWANGKDSFDDYILEERTWTNIKRNLRKKRYYDDVIFPKTRKLIDGGKPLGFVMLTLQ